MKIRLKDAIKLFNARQELKNEKAGRDLHWDKTNQMNVGRVILPDGSDTAKVMSRIAKGGNKTIAIEYVLKISELLGVDANFLFGMPSKHDRDFNKLCGDVGVYGKYLLKGVDKLTTYAKD